MIKVFARRKGEIFVLLSCAIGSAFPVIAVLSFSAIQPLFSVALSTLIAALFFAAAITLRERWRPLWRCPAWKPILLTSLFIGIIFHALVYIGLLFTTAGNTALLLLLEVLFSFLILGVVLRHEPLFPSRVAGAALMAAGAAVVLLPEASNWQLGNLLVLCATVFGPLGNKYAQEARRGASSLEIMFWRSLLSGAFLLLLACCFETPPALEALRESFWVLAVNGLFVFAISKVLWIEGINLIPITVAISLVSISPALTMGLAFFALEERITIFQLLGLPLLGAGAVLVMKKSSPAAAAAVTA